MNTRILVLFGLILYALSCIAGVTFKFAANSIDASSLRTRMENNISALLTEINRAGSNGSSLNFTGISMEQAAKERLIALWNDSRFVCDKPTNISKCLHDFQGFQVRAIPITMKPQNASYNKSLTREIMVSLNKDGVITGVRIAWELNEDVNKILATTGRGGVMETRMRREILKWIEDFKSFYAERNIDAIDKIINSSFNIQNNRRLFDISTVDNKSDSIYQKVYYKGHNGQNYINRLRKLFEKKDPISVEFDHISVMKHGAIPNIYGMTIHQILNTDFYNDAGWLFALWDFNDADKPQIRYITWQSDEDVTIDGVYTLDDFFVP